MFLLLQRQSSTIFHQRLTSEMENSIIGYNLQLLQIIIRAT